MTQMRTRSKVQNTPMLRPRADSSAVARFNVADLEPARLREKVVRESKKAPPRQARRQRGTKPGQQRRPHSTRRLFTATSKEEISSSRRYVSPRKENTDSHPAQRRDLAQFKSVGSLPRAMQERSVRNMTRSRI